MGRGLSDLQQTILSLFLHGQGQGFLRSRELLEEIWGKELERAEYNAAHACLSRALTRLWRRGLIEIWKNITGSATAVTLTDGGVEAARRLTKERR